MMNQYEKKLRRAVAALVRAEVDNSWKGAGHPDEAFDIELRVKAQRLKTAVVLKEVAELAQKHDDFWDNKLRGL